MIKIQQRLSKKIPGGTSLFISFQFNQQIIDIIKDKELGYEPFYNWDSKNKEWEVPISSLSYLIDRLTYLDDIQIDLIKEKEERPLRDIIGNHKTNMYPYQRDGVEFGLNNDNFLLLDAPGLGKSLQAIYLAEELKEQENIEHCLIICGVNSLKTNWQKEIKKHSKLDCIVLGQKVNSKGNITYSTIKERAKQLKSKIKEFFIITNIESLRDSDFVNAFLKSENKIDMVVVDEIHKAKSVQAQQTKGLIKLSKVKHKIAMTGTLIMNNPLDSYVPLKWIGAENCSYTNFKYFYCKFGGQFNNFIIGYQNTSLLKEQIDGCSIRRTKDILDLPPKQIVEEVLEMDNDQQQFYLDIKSGVKESADKVDLSTSSLLSLVTRLRQASDCPSILTTEKISSSKIQRAYDITKETIENGEKVVIFSVFKQPLNELYELLKDDGALLCTGDIDDKTISDNIDKFQTDNNYKVMLCTTSKMGTGVTLTSATTEIFISSCWTQALETQCEDRCWRIGQKNKLTVYKLINHNTIDERVAEILKVKGAMSDYVIDDKLSDSTIDNLRKYIEEL